MNSKEASTDLAIVGKDLRVALINLPQMRGVPGVERQEGRLRIAGQRRAHADAALLVVVDGNGKLLVVEVVVVVSVIRMSGRWKYKEKDEHFKLESECQ
jgi:hypothetical protein